MANNKRPREYDNINSDYNTFNSQNSPINNKTTYNDNSKHVNKRRKTTPSNDIIVNSTSSILFYSSSSEDDDQEEIDKLNKDNNSDDSSSSSINSDDSFISNSDIDNNLEFFRKNDLTKDIEIQLYNVNNGFSPFQKADKDIEQWDNIRFEDKLGDIITDNVMFDSFASYAKDLYEEKASLSYIPERHEAASNRTYWHKHTSGESILKHIRQVLDEFGYTRTDQQKVFHEHMINACLPIIFGDELQFHMDRILKENSWEEIMQELLCVTPRRFGKTWAVAMFCAAILVCVPYVEVVVFAMAMRAARKMLALIDKFLSRHEEGNKMLCRPHNQERLTLRGDTGADDERFCLSLPGRSDVCIFILYSKKPPEKIHSLYKVSFRCFILA